MFDQINTIYNSILAMSRENQFLAAGLSMYGIAAVTYLLRDVPRRIFSFIASQSVTTLSVDNTGNTMNLVRFNQVIGFINNQAGNNLSRQLKLRSSANWADTDKGAREFKQIKEEIQIGDGLHFFIWNKKLYWARREALASTGSSQEKAIATISTFGRSHESLVKLIEAALPDDMDQKGTYLFRPDSVSSWNRICEIVPRSMDSIAAPKELKEDIVDSIKEFLASEDWYVQKGITYKEVHILHGPTGTGKTSLIRAISSLFKLPVFEVDLCSVSNNSLLSLLAYLPKRCICLIEDLDSSGATSRRNNLEVARTPKLLESTRGFTGKAIEGILTQQTVTTQPTASTFDPLTISGLLNALDGISGSPGVIYFLSTNCIDSLDPALLRKGRADWVRYIGPVGDTEIKDYINYIFPEYKIPEDTVFSDIVGCDLYAAFKENKHDAEAFIEQLPKDHSMGQSKKIFNLGNYHHHDHSL